MRHDTQIKSSILLFLILLLPGCAKLAYQHMNDPSRDAWQKPAEVIAKLAITPGSRVADLGAGGGYFTWHLAGAVESRGTVYAVEIDDTALSIINTEMKTRGITNVTPIQADAGDAKLPEPVDLAFSCDTYHHMTDRIAYFRSLQRHLTLNGRVAILDFHPQGFFAGLLGHGTSKEDVQHEMEAAGYKLARTYDIIGSQHFQIFSMNNS